MVPVHQIMIGVVIVAFGSVLRMCRTAVSEELVAVGGGARFVGDVGEIGVVAVGVPVLLVDGEFGELFHRDSDPVGVGIGVDAGDGRRGGGCGRATGGAAGDCCDAEEWEREAGSGVGDELHVGATAQPGTGSRSRSPRP